MSSIFSLPSYHILMTLTINLCPFYTKSVKYRLTVSHLLYCCYSQAACEPTARVNWLVLRKLVINTGERGMASSTTFTQGLMPARCPPARSETPLFCADIGQERNQSQPLSSDRLYKAYRLLWLFPLGHSLAVSSGRYSPHPSPSMAACRWVLQSPPARPEGALSHRALLALTSASLMHEALRDV